MDQTKKCKDLFSQVSTYVMNKIFFKMSDKFEMNHSFLLLLRMDMINLVCMDSITKNILIFIDILWIDQKVYLSDSHFMSTFTAYTIQTTDNPAFTKEN